MNAPNERSDGAARPTFLIKPGNGDTAIVAFSGLRSRRGEFNLERALDENMSNFPRLFIRDPNSHWYNSEIAGLGQTIDQIADKIKQETDRLGAARIVAIGPSMGGYAAILFGCVLGAERAIAIAPQTLLDPGLRHAPPVDVRLQAPDLKPFVRAARTQVDIVAGWDDHNDVFHAQRVARFPSVRILALPYQLHEIGRPFPRERRRVLPRELLETDVPRDCKVNPVIDAESETRIAEIAYAVVREDWKTVARCAWPVIERNPIWAGPRFDLARALVKSGDWCVAEEVCLELLELAPEWPQARAQLAEVLLATGRHRDAETLVRAGLATDEDWALGHLLLARCLASYGLKDQARRSAQHAAQLSFRVAPKARAFLAELGSN